MKTLMSATALTALVAASSAFGQAQQDPASDPMLAPPPAATEQAPAMDAQPITPAPEMSAPDAMEPQTGEVETPAAPDEVSPTEQAVGPTEIFIPQQEPGEILASSMIGSTVANPAGESLGDINDVVLTEGGSVDGVILGVGGFLGIGEKDVAVNFEAIEKAIDVDGNVVLTLNASHEELENAPQYITVAGLRQQEQQLEQQAPPAAPAAPTPNQ